MACTLHTLTTPDGACPVYLMTPAVPGQRRRWPAVVFYGDAGGIRPAMMDMAQQLADAGYAVLLPDLYYRYGPYKPLVPAEVFKGDVMAILGPLMATTDNLKAARDTEVFIAFLDACDAVSGGRLGAVGFCMGGRMAITAAATYSDRFAAVASFHGGHLATDEPASPHLLANKLKAEVYVAGADQDDSYPPAMAERLGQALTHAGVTHASETYFGAAHGWMVPDFPTYDAAAAERGWKALLDLFKRNLPV
jgi:carboxymethylenebutenolidase